MAHADSPDLARPADAASDAPPVPPTDAELAEVPTVPPLVAGTASAATVVPGPVRAAVGERPSRTVPLLLVVALVFCVAFAIAAWIEPSLVPTLRRVLTGA